MLGGAFGWGLKRNVLDIYRYACRNYREGDDIYAFGFSRGAFTARLVVALIAARGWCGRTSEAELDAQSRAGLSSLPNRPAAAPAAVADQAGTPAAGMVLPPSWDQIRGRHGLRPRRRTARANIRFVGVWDTVAAYGGPIVEITRAIDNWIFRLSMPDYKLTSASSAPGTPWRSTTSATPSSRCCGTRCTRSS